MNKLDSIINEHTEINSGDIILHIIDLFNIEKDKNKFHFLTKGKNRPPDEPNATIIKRLRKKLNEKLSDSDTDYFMVDLSRLRIWKTFDQLNIAQDVLNNFKKIDIEPPVFVKNCYKEIEKRSLYIDYLIDKKKYEFNKKEISEFNSSLEKELSEYSYDEESKQNYLKDKFQNIVNAIKEYEAMVLNEYGYYIHSFYDTTKFIATKEELNEFFFHAEMEKENINEFYTIHKLLTNYIKAKNQLQQLRKRLSNTGETLPFDTIINNFDGIPINIVHGHFKKYLVDNGHLTEKELFEYLNAAFQEKTSPRQLFKMRNKHNVGEIKAYFYSYYHDIASQEKSTHGKGKDYASLLGEYFYGFNTNEVYSNWQKSYKKK